VTNRRLSPRLQTASSSSSGSARRAAGCERQLLLQHHPRALRFSGSLRDPTNIDRVNGFQYSPSGGIGGGGGSNLAGIPVNAKWVAKLNGSYRLAVDVNVVRQPTCARVSVCARPQHRSRPNRARPSPCADPLGEQRFPDFATMDLRLERAFRVRGMKVLPRSTCQRVQWTR